MKDTLGSNVCFVRHACAVGRDRIPGDARFGRACLFSSPVATSAISSNSRGVLLGRRNTTLSTNEAEEPDKSVGEQLASASSAHTAAPSDG